MLDPTAAVADVLCCTGIERFREYVMIAGPPLLDAIREHYDRLSSFYGVLWGEHIHHGYWEADESAAVAQEKLVARLAERARIPRGGRVLDIGCGLGGSALWLARNLNCEVTGITISPVQVEISTKRARAANLTERVRFLQMDANQLEWPTESFDTVWVIECSEHVSDKARLMASAAQLLTRGGTLALCAWLAKEADRAEHGQLVTEVCQGMLCPSLASMQQYIDWMAAGGLTAIEAEDLTERVKRTWGYCAAIVARPEIRALLRIMDGRTRDFVQSFAAIHRAYATGAMAYGMFTARKP